MNLNKYSEFMKLVANKNSGIVIKGEQTDKSEMAERNAESSSAEASIEERVMRISLQPGRYPVAKHHCKAEPISPELRRHHQMRHNCSYLRDFLEARARVVLFYKCAVLHENNEYDPKLITFLNENNCHLMEILQKWMFYHDLPFGLTWEDLNVRENIFVPQTSDRYSYLRSTLLTEFQECLNIIFYDCSFADVDKWVFKRLKDWLEEKGYEDNFQGFEEQETDLDVVGVLRQSVLQCEDELKQLEEMDDPQRSETTTFKDQHGVVVRHQATQTNEDDLKLPEVVKSPQLSEAIKSEEGGDYKNVTARAEKPVQLDKTFTNDTPGDVVKQEKDETEDMKMDFQYSVTNPKRSYDELTDTDIKTEYDKPDKKHKAE